MHFLAKAIVQEKVMGHPNPVWLHRMLMVIEDITNTLYKHTTKTRVMYMWMGGEREREREREREKTIHPSSIPGFQAYEPISNTLTY